MVVVPAVSAVISPVFEIVATAISEEAQAFAAAAVPLPESCNVLFTQSDAPPEIVGFAKTVTGTTTVHPFVFVYVMFVLPAETAFTRPVFDTVATPPALEVHPEPVAEPFN
jgi:hypothetical protein